MLKTKYKKIFFSGVGGIGVSALLRFFKKNGVVVVGSDMNKSEITEDLEREGVKIYYQQTGEYLDKSFDLFVYSAAVPVISPERKICKTLDIRQQSYFEVLGELSREYRTVAVSGTNGKSTTTAMIGSILADAELDPTIIVGSQYHKFEHNFRAGASDLFVMEACEYRAHMLLVEPRALILTNIEEDHLDYYRDLNHIVETFQQYVNKLNKSADNILVINNDDLNIRKLILPNCKIIKFGMTEDADVYAKSVRKLPGKQLFNVFYGNADLGEFELLIPGDFNIYNALGAIAMALSLGVMIGQIRDSIKDFTGIWRRFEVLENNEITVVSDYAHHPTAVEKTIQAAKEFYPGRRMVVVFQPHQKDRTQKLFDGFTRCFRQADVVILPEIYFVPGREDEIQISSNDLVVAIKKETLAKDIYFASDLAQTQSLVQENLRSGDVFLVMGAGDVYQIVNNIKFSK